MAKILVILNHAIAPKWKWNNSNW